MVEFVCCLVPDPFQLGSNMSDDERGRHFSEFARMESGLTGVRDGVMGPSN